MPYSRFLFARLNVIAQYDDKTAFILGGLQQRQLRRVREHLWGFFDVEQLAEQPEFVTGYLAKLRPEYAEEVGDLDRHEISITSVSNRAIAKSRFFLEIPTGLISYQLVGREVTQPIFEEQFARLFEEGYKRFFVSVGVQTVEERASFIEALRTFDRVQTISIELHPTNPHYSEIYRTFDERLKAVHAKQYRETLSAARDGPGLNAGDDSDVQRKAAMAEDGYGRVTAVGTRDGRAARASTRENPVAAQAETRDRRPSDILNDLRENFREIMRRAAL